MGLPEMNMEFRTRGLEFASGVKNGIVAAILKDDTNVAIENIAYRGIEEIKEEDWSKKNYDYLKMILKGSPAKVIVYKVTTAETNYNEVLLKLRDKRWNYLTIPEISQENVEDIATYIRTQRKNKKTFKAVLPNCKGDSQGIINFTTEYIKVGDKEYTTAEYCGRIAGILAGMPVDRSATNYSLTEVTEVPTLEEPDEAINKGELILVDDGEDVVIGRGVNSLTTLTATQGKSFKKIRIVEIVDKIRDDITYVWKKHYSGKIVNIYDNKILLIAAINKYYRDLERQFLLDPTYGNTNKIDVIGQKEYLLSVDYHTSSGKTVGEMTEQEIKEANTDDKVFLDAAIKPADTMEDCDFLIYL